MARPDLRAVAVAAVAACAAAGGVAAVATAGGSGGGSSGGGSGAASSATASGSGSGAAPSAKARAAASGFPFGDDVALTIDHLGVIHFRCVAGGRIVATYRHPNTQHATVRTAGGARRSFSHGQAFVAPAQGAGRQTWTTSFSGESARETATAVIDFAITPSSHVCYARSTRLTTKVTPTSR